jgi:formamidopyrimidine-DNA glycosylase
VEKLAYIFNHAIKCLCTSREYPSDWLFNYRWDKRNAKAVAGGLRMPDGNKIEFIDVGGRTSAIVPAVLSRTKLKSKSIDEAVNQQETLQAKPKRKAEKTKKRIASTPDKYEAVEPLTRRKSIRTKK